MPLMNLGFALSASIFFATLAAILSVYGNDAVRAFVVISLFLGAVSQFLGQDDNHKVVTFALYMSYIAMLMALVAVILFVFTL